MKGYELMKLVNEGKLSLEQKVSSISPDYKNCTIYFALKDIAFNIMNLDFEIIEEQQDIDIQDIIELTRYEDIADYDYRDIDINRDKINELVEVVKQLDKNIKEKE